MIDSVVQDILLTLEVGGGALHLLIGLLWFSWFVAILHCYYLWKVFEFSWQDLYISWESFSSFPKERRESIRSEVISKVRLLLFGRLSVLKIIVAVSPLCGLLGTVSGMIDVFDIVGSSGTGNVRALATGISRATFSTAVGIIVSLIALGIYTFLRRVSYKKMLECEELLNI